jgi:hypothetical protein
MAQKKRHPAKGAVFGFRWMKKTEYNEQLERLDLTSIECAKLFGYSKRSSQRWDNDGPPRAVAALIRIATRPSRCPCACRRR